MNHGVARTHCALLVLLLSTAPVWMQTNSRQPHGFLQKYFNFSKEDLAAIEIGKIVAKLPKTIDKREVAALGVVHMSVSKELFLERFMDIESFKKRLWDKFESSAALRAQKTCESLTLNSSI